MIIILGVLSELYSEEFLFKIESKGNHRNICEQIIWKYHEKSEITRKRILDNKLQKGNVKNLIYSLEKKYKFG